MLRASLCLLAGALAPQLISFPLYSNDNLEGLILIVVSISAALVYLLPKLRRSDFVWVLLGSVTFLLAVDRVIDARLDPALAGDSMLTEIRVIDFVRVRDGTSTFLATAFADERIPARIRLSWIEAPTEIRLGDVWRVEIRLQRPRGSSNPGGMDYEAWLTRERIGATGYVVPGKRNRLLEANVLTNLDRLRLRYLERLDRAVDEAPVTAVIAAIVIGTRHRVTSEQWERYAITGTSHLMAISGLHIGLAAGGAYLLAMLCGSFLPPRGNQHVRALLIASLGAALYAIISGFGVPARRAVLMLSLAIAVLLCRRELSPVRVLAAAAVASVLIDPLSTMSPGFRLSFAAVAILIWLARGAVVASAHWSLTPILGLANLSRMQLSLLAGLLPLTVLGFARVSFVAVIINLIAVPLFSFVTVPLCLLGLIFDGPFQVLGDSLLRLAGLSIGLLEKMIAVAASLPAAAYTIAKIEGLAWLYMLVPLLWALLPRQWPGRYIVFPGLIALVLWRPERPPKACVDIAALDVGQGLAIVLQTANKNLVYDTGPAYRSGGSAAARVLVPYLQSRGVRHLNHLVVSHADLDHAGGVNALLDYASVSEVSSGDDILVPGTMPGTAQSTAIRRCRAGTAWKWDGVSFRFLHPDVDSSYEGNDASCVLLVEAGEHRALLTGDIEAVVEADLVRSRRLPFVDIVTVPHHGSSTSSISPFVESLKPSYAIVSTAWGNRWGFPKPDVVARWRRTGATVLNTATGGAISVRLCADNDEIRPVLHRVQTRRIWQDSGL